MPPRPAATEPVTAAHRLGLWLPGGYFVQTRLPSWRLRAGWWLGFGLPVLALATLGHGDWGGLPIALAVLVAVYAAYEFGYIVNDAVVTTREDHPTERLPPAVRQWYRARLLPAAAARGAIGLAALGVAQALGGDVAGPVLAGWCALWPVFALYNLLRGRVTLLLYLVLSGLRFGLPVLAALSHPEALPPWPAWPLLYALPNTYVAAWKPRYALPVLQRPFAHEPAFRLAWHALLAAGAVAWALASEGVGAEPFAAVTLYLLAVRVAALVRLSAPRGAT